MNSLPRSEDAIVPVDSAARLSDHRIDGTGDPVGVEATLIGWRFVRSGGNNTAGSAVVTRTSKVGVLIPSAWDMTVATVLAATRSPWWRNTPGVCTCRRTGDGQWRSSFRGPRVAAADR